MKNLDIQAIAVGGMSYHPHSSRKLTLGKAGTIDEVIAALRLLFRGAKHTDRFQFFIGKSHFSIESANPNLSFYQCLGFFTACAVEYAKDETSEYWAKSEFVGETQP